MNKLMKLYGIVGIILYVVSNIFNLPTLDGFSMGLMSVVVIEVIYYLFKKPKE